MKDLPQVSPTETAKLLDLLHSCLSVDGSITEFGCYKGDTSLEFAKLLKSEDSDKLLYLYDSFSGLPEKSPQDSSPAGDQFKSGELLATKHEVIIKFKKSNLKVPIIKKAFFSDLTSADLPERIAFAFLDGDLYDSIKTSLHLTVPRLARQGLIVVHDYNNPALPGSARAVDEFLTAHPDFHLRQFETLAILSQKITQKVQKSNPAIPPDPPKSHQK